MNDLAITLTRRYATARRTVFEAWTRPRLLRRWAFGAESRATKCVRVDLFPGGQLELIQRGGLFNQRSRWGRFHEVHAPRRLCFTLTSNEPSLRGADTRVTVDIDGSPQESTLTLTQEGFPDEAARDASRATWETLLDRLEKALQDS